MPGFNDGFLDVPERPGKPREIGLTHVMDKGLNLRDIEGMFDVGGQFVDIVKLGWGTSYVTNNLEKKIALYRHFETPIVCGGTLFEAVYGRGRMDEFKHWLQENRFSHVEISDGTLEIPRDRKLELIEEFARDFVVLSEVGSKDSDVVYAPYQWVEWIKEEKEAGAWKVITEAREGGTAGIFRKDGDMRTGLIDEVAHEIAVGPDLRGPDEVVAGVVRQALRPQRQPRQHPPRGGDPARDAPPGAARGHAQGGAAWPRRACNSLISRPCPRRTFSIGRTSSLVPGCA
jgi:phosphosulfolactate synthase